ncbi:MAG: hypothetical protein KIT59_10290 [Nitrosomonas sp.]|nr:hypothetical protein [Nitrosomonas sp.]
MLACQRYIKLNPVRASMVMHPAGYRWPSYQVNLRGTNDGLVKPHPLYMALRLDASDGLPRAVPLRIVVGVSE